MMVPFNRLQFEANQIQSEYLSIRVITNPKKRLAFIINVCHILMFYTLLLASVSWFEKYLSWILQLTSLVLIANCYFYTILFYVNNAKNSILILRRKTITRTLSQLFTIIYVMNLSLTYYFSVGIYPTFKGPDAHRLLVIYSYPGLSVWINLITDFNYTKPLHFRQFDGSVIILSLYVGIVAVLRYMFNGPMLTETELGRAVWFDPTNLMERFQVFVIIMSINYLGLKAMFRFKAFRRHLIKQKLRAQRLRSEIRY